METNRLQRKVKPYGGAMIALGWVGKGITDAGRSKQGRLVEWRGTWGALGEVGRI